MSIIPRVRPATPDVRASRRRVGVVAYVLARMPLVAELFAPMAVGETLSEYAARRQAAADILDDLISEYAVEYAGLIGRSGR